MAEKTLDKSTYISGDKENWKISKLMGRIEKLEKQAKEFEDTQEDREMYERAIKALSDIIEGKQGRQGEVDKQALSWWLDLAKKRLKIIKDIEGQKKELGNIMKSKSTQ